MGVIFRDPHVGMQIVQMWFSRCSISLAVGDDYSSSRACARCIPRRIRAELRQRADPRSPSTHCVYAQPSTARRLLADAVDLARGPRPDARGYVGARAGMPPAFAIESIFGSSLWAYADYRQASVIAPRACSCEAELSVRAPTFPACP